MFELSWALTICSNCSPIVLPQNIFMSTLIYHWFNSKYMSLFHESYNLRKINKITCCFIIFIMRDGWCTMKKLANPMSSVSPSDSKPVLLNIFAYHISNFPVHDTGSTDIDGHFKSFVSFFNKKFGTFWDFTHCKSLV